MAPRFISGSLALLAMVVLGCQQTLKPVGDPVWPDRVPPGQIDFEQSVRPILEYHCLECHNSALAHEFAGLNLETRNLAMTTGRHAPVIVPGKPEDSLFIQVLELSPHHVYSMPAAQEKVEGVRLELLKTWIAQGASWPDGRPLREAD